MSVQLKLDEMQEALSRLNHPSALAFEAALCGIGDAMAAELCRLTGAKAEPATQQGAAFAGICAPFSPSYRGQPFPDAFEGLDGDGREVWEDMAEDDELPASPRYTANVVRVGGVYQDGVLMGTFRGDDAEAPATAERVAAALNMAEG